MTRPRVVPAPEGHSCSWLVVEVRRDSAGRQWARDECSCGLSGGWFLRDGSPGEPPWPQPAELWAAYAAQVWAEPLPPG